MGGLEEECPEFEQKFVDLRTLSDHFEKEHGSSYGDDFDYLNIRKKSW